MSCYGIIPARYASTRFPGKPLALINDKPMVQWVYEQSSKAHLDKVCIATEDERIINTCKIFKALAIMTGKYHVSGTDRCGEAAQILNLTDQDIVINIQGDEPFIRPDEINILIDLFQNPEVEIATLITKMTHQEDIMNPNKVKVVKNIKGQALYFSRFPIPYIRQEKKESPCFYKHIGLYAYRYKTLKELICLQPSSLELAESLEQLRWLENGFKIYTACCDYESIAIDTPEDLEKAKDFFNNQHITNIS